jgi:methylated-DNA-[protein]-cysteine S-methyltransferase
MPARAIRLEYSAKLRTPFGVLGIREGGERIVGIDYLPRDTVPLVPRTTLARRMAREPGHTIDLPWSMNASGFEASVWEAIREIPSGQVRTYGDIARKVHSIPRAVGGACGRNPLPLIIPCHRVVAAGGLGGFMGGHEDDPLAIKRWLLRHEGALR